MAPRKIPGLRIKKISSRHHPSLKTFTRALSEGTTREGFLAFEGPHLLEESLVAGFKPRTVMASSSARAKFGSLLGRLPPRTQLIEVPDRVFRAVSETKTPQGLAALVERRRVTFAEILMRPRLLLVVACGIQDPGNLGGLWRGATALGASALVTLKGTVSPFLPKTVRASAGAVFRLPVFENWKLSNLVRKLRSSNVLIFGGDAKGRIPLHGANFTGQVALLVGQEGSGLPEEARGHADALVRIPMRGDVESLNAAVAGTLFLYEAARQRGFRYFP